MKPKRSSSHEARHEGDTQIVEGGSCLLFANGSDQNGQFVRENH